MATTPVNPFLQYVPAISALAGVVVGGIIQTVTAFLLAKTTRSDRLKDEQAARDRDNAKLQARENYSKALVARHLEGFARSCAETIWANGEYDAEGAMSPPTFPEWPADIEWQLLGAREMMKARDIELRVEIRHQGVQGHFEYVATDESDAREIFSEGAARIGWEAWTIAKDIRDDIGVEPFRYPDIGGNHAETLENAVAALEERARIHTERQEEKRRVAEAAGKEYDPLD
ncbi:hypothetical protein D3C73_288560 [compost metagenome]